MSPLSDPPLCLPVPTRTGLTNWTNGIHSCRLPHKSAYDNILSQREGGREGERDLRERCISFCDLLIRIYCCRLSRFTYPCTSYSFNLQAPASTPATTSMATPSPDDRWQAMGAAVCYVACSTIYGGLLQSLQLAACWLALQISQSQRERERSAVRTMVDLDNCWPSSLFAHNANEKCCKLAAQPAPAPTPALFPNFATSY